MIELAGPRGRALSLVLLLAAVTGCRNRVAELVNFDASAAAPPSPPLAEEPHQVHFTYTGPDAVTFDWAQGGTTMRVWAKDIPARVVEAHAPSLVPSASPGPWRQAVVDGLVPGKEYFYQVGNPVRPEPISFRAPPARGAETFTFAAVGDVGTGSDYPAAKSLHRILRIADPSLVLVLGDLTYASARNRDAIDRHFDESMAWSRRAAYMPAWGNHEWQQDGGDGLLADYKSRFALPNGAPARGAPGGATTGKDWYWFDYGTVRFIVYPEPYTRDTWTDWAAAAERVFAAAQQDPALRFVVTAGHRPAYSSGHAGGDEQLRTILDGFGRRFSKYVLNLAGHSHVYERTKPQAHVVHVTAGIGGAPLEHAATPCKWDSCTPPAFSARRALHHGFVELIVRPDVIRLEAVGGASSPGEDDVYCGQGEIFDSVEIPAPEPVNARKRPAQASSN